MRRRISSSVDGGRAEDLACADPGASGNFSSCSYLVVLPPLLKTTEGVVLGFEILHGLLTNKNKNYGNILFEGLKVTLQTRTPENFC